MNEPRFIIEEVTDPEEVARFRAHDEQAQRNEEWLQAHWADLLPRAVGKFIAVGGQEAFVADTPQGARALAAAAHPDDTGILVQYIRPEKGPRIYANRR